MTSHDCFPISGGREGYAEVEEAFRAHGVTQSLYASEAPGYHEAPLLAHFRTIFERCPAVSEAPQLFLAALRALSVPSMWRWALLFTAQALSPCDEEAGKVCPMSVGKEIGSCLEDPSQHQLTDIDGNPIELEPGARLPGLLRISSFFPSMFIDFHSISSY